MKNRTLTALQYLLGWPFSILAFIFILKLIAPKIPQFLSSIHSLNIPMLLIGIFCFLAFYFIRSYVWYLLVRLYSPKITYRESSYFWAISEVKRYVPGSVWSFMGRAVLFSEKGINKKDMGKLLITEAILLVLGVATISLISLPFVATELVSFLVYPLEAMAVLTVVILCLIYIFRKRYFKILPVYEPSENAFQIFLSSAAFLFFGFGNYFAISSISALPIQLAFQLSGFFVLSFLIGYLTLLTPAGFGVREGVMITGLSKFTSVAQSAFAALYSRVVLIISELIFISILYTLYKSRDKKLLAVEKYIDSHKHEAVLVLMFLMYTIYFSVASFMRYDNFYAGRFDLGNMAQTVWNTTRGRPFVFTNPNGTEMISRLAFHADFILVLLAPLYAIVPSPKTLLFLQAIIVAAGSFFVYLIGKEKLKNKNLALVFAFTYLINPSIQRVTLYDFHSVALATTFLLGTYYFYSKEKYAMFMLFAVLAALCKEEVWLIIALFGGLLSLKKNTRVAGGFLFIISISIFYYLISYAIPNALGSRHFALAYYSDFGDSPLSIIKSMILSPKKIFLTILQKSRIDYLTQLFAPVGYLSIFSPFYLIFAMPDLTINLLSNNAQLHQIYYHYTSGISPFIFISAILGVVVLRKFITKIPSAVFIMFILFTSIISAYQYGPLPGAIESNIDMFTKQIPDRKFIDNYLLSIPRRKSVASSNNIGSHLSQRQRIYTLPLGIDKADIVVFLLNDTESQNSIDAERDQLKKIRNDKNYELTVEKNSFIVFKKNN